MYRPMLTIGLFTLFAGTATAAPDTGAVIVEVTKLRNLRGKVGCQIFLGEDGFPSEGAKARSGKTLKPEGNSVTCRFEGLPAGRYAVSVMHDENGNGKLDTNFFGIPSEGYGASNNALPSMAPPAFEASSFEVEAGATKKLEVKMKY